jgi:heat shock protein HtpX
MERAVKLTGGPADLTRSTVARRAAANLLTAAALSSVLIVAYAPAAIGVTITSWFWIGLGLGPLSGLLMTLVIGSVCLLCCLPVVVMTLLHSRGIVLQRARSARPSAEQLQRLENVVAEMAVAAGVPTPQVVVVRGLGANAMAVGDASRPTIAVSPELIDLLDRQQLQAVIAHEVAHVVNGDLYSSSILAATYVRYELLRQRAREEAGAGELSVAGGAPLRLLITVFRPGLWLGWGMARLTGLAAARQREFLADSTACRLTRDPESLIKALTIVAEANRARSGWADDVAHLCIVEPFARESSASWIAPHPPLSVRIERLQRLKVELESLS